MDRNSVRNENKKVAFEDIPPVNLVTEDPEPKPKVLLAGIETSMYSCSAMRKGWEDNGYDVTFFDWQKIKSETNREEMIERLLVRANMDKPDVIFLHFQIPGTITPDEANVLSENGFVVNYTEDVRDDISWYESVAPFIGLTLFTNIDDVNKLNKKEIMNVGYVPASYNDLWYMKTAKSRTNNYGEIIFIGNNYKDTSLQFEKAEERVEMVNFLRKLYGSKFKVWGRGWEGSDMLNPQQEVEAYNNCKVAITHNNFYRGGYTSDRLFRATGCGACTISQYYPGLNQHFINTEIGTWLNFDMLAEGINFFLRYDKQREWIASLGYDRTMKDHRWKNRIEDIRRLIHTHSSKNLVTQ